MLNSLHPPTRNATRGKEIKPITVTKFYEKREMSTEREIKPIKVTSSPQHAVSSPPKHPASASNATRELDDLMASLSDFKVVCNSINDRYQLISLLFKQDEGQGWRVRASLAENGHDDAHAGAARLDARQPAERHEQVRRGNRRQRLLLLLRQAHRRTGENGSTTAIDFTNAYVRRKPITHCARPIWH